MPYFSPLVNLLVRNFYRLYKEGQAECVPNFWIIGPPGPEIRHIWRNLWSLKRATSINLEFSGHDPSRSRSIRPLPSFYFQALTEHLGHHHHVWRGGERDCGGAEDPLQAAGDEQRPLQGQVQAQAQPPHQRPRSKKVLWFASVLSAFSDTTYSDRTQL